MVKLLILVVLFGYMFGDGFGWNNQSESKYDNQISKYAIGLNSIRYKYTGGTDCREISLKEREAIVSDIKSGRFKIKTHPELTGVFYLSNNFASGKEYIYYTEKYSCYRHNRDAIVEEVKSDRGY